MQGIEEIKEENEEEDESSLHKSVQRGFSKEGSNFPSIHGSRRGSESKIDQTSGVRTWNHRTMTMSEK